MNKLNLILSVCLLASAGYASTETLEPKQQDNWTQIKANAQTIAKSLASGALMGAAYYFAKPYVHASQFSAGLKTLKAAATEALKADLFADHARMNALYGDWDAQYGISARK